MKIGLYSPYVPKHVGGGEKYFFDVATTLASLGHQVQILLESQLSTAEDELTNAKKKYETFLGISLADVEFIHSPLGKSGSQLQKVQFTKQFDVIYLVTDGSLFFSQAKKNILHIQIPFTSFKSSVIEKLKLHNWSIKNANSQFTKHIVEKSWNTSIPFVHYPMVDIPSAKYSEKNKQKIILNVGRFFDHLHSKRQDVLVSAFIQLIESNPNELKGWKLVLVGPAEDEAYAKKIATMANGYPIEILHTVNRTKLLNLYERATFYWHAAGFEVDENEHPEKVEHFGISTVEAMNFGCIPLVVGKGGQIEVLGSSLQNLLWQKESELVEMTSNLISDDTQRALLAEQAIKQSKRFDKSSFVHTLQEMLK